MAEQRRTSSAFPSLTALVLVLCAAAVGCFHVWNLRPANYWPYVPVIATCLTACVIQLLLSVVSPDLFGEGPPQFPRSLTLPVVYVALLVMCTVIWDTTGAGGNSLVRPPEVFQSLLVWTNPVALLTVAVLQFVGLSMLSQAGR